MRNWGRGGQECKITLLITNTVYDRINLSLNNNNNNNGGNNGQGFKSSLYLITIRAFKYPLTCGIIKFIGHDLFLINFFHNLLNDAF